MENLKRFDSMTVPQLKQVAKKRALKSTGRKQDLKTRIKAWAADHPEEEKAIEAGESSAAATAADEDGDNENPLPANAVSAMLLHQVHPVVQECADLLGVDTSMTVDDDLALDASLAADMEVIRGCITLVRDAVQSMTALSSSHSRNQQNLAAAVKRMIDTVEASIEVQPILTLFGITVLPRSTQASLDLQYQVTALAEVVAQWYSVWSYSFPAPENPIFPSDFDEGERGRLRKLVRDYADDDETPIDCSAPVDEATLEAAMQDIYTTDPFPVPAGKTESVIKALFAELIERRVKRARQAKGKGKAKAVEGTSEGEDTEEEVTR